MAIRHLSYLNLTPEQRTAAASVAQGRIRMLLASPSITPEQVAQLRQEKIRLAQWVEGLLTPPT